MKKLEVILSDGKKRVVNYNLQIPKNTGIRVRSRMLPTRRIEHITTLEGVVRIDELSVNCHIEFSKIGEYITNNTIIIQNKRFDEGSKKGLNDLVQYVIEGLN